MTVAAPLAPATTPSIQAPAVRRHLPALDGVRGLAILLVLVHHLTPSTGDATGLLRQVLKVAHLGWVGVDLFFVLSGFLITGILLDARRDPQYFRNFYMRRTLRIFPLYYGVQVVIFGILPFIASPWSADARTLSSQQAWFWTYTTNLRIAWQGDWMFNGEWLRLTHFWSLAVEEQFYLIWPAVVLWLRPALLKRTCIWLIVSALVLRAAIAPMSEGYVTVFVFTPCRIDTLAAGALLAVWAREWELSKLLLASRWLLNGGIAIVACIVLTTAGFSSANFAVKTVGYTALAAIFASVVIGAAAAERDSGLGRLWSWRPLRFMGTYSYGIYVFHELIAPAMEHWIPISSISTQFGSRWLGIAGFFLLSASVSTLAALASYHAMEKHFLRLKRFFDPHPGLAEPR